MKKIKITLMLIIALALCGCLDKGAPTAEDLALNWWYYEIPSCYDEFSVGLIFVNTKGPIYDTFSGNHMPTSWKAGDLLKVVIIDTQTDMMIYSLLNENSNESMTCYMRNLSENFDQGYFAIQNGKTVSAGDILLRKSRDQNNPIKPTGPLGENDLGIAIRIETMK